MNKYFNGSGTIGFTCDKCGREMQGCTWVNGMKFCANCYQEIFKNNIIQFVDLLNKEMYELKISDLEAKLAESENKVRVEEFWRRVYQDRVYDELIQEYEENRKLKQQLAEKEKEIISLECVISEIHNDIKEMHEFKVGEDEYDLTDSDARFSLQCDLLNNEQDKISFAVEQLTEIREYVKECWGLDELEGKVRLDIAKKIRLKIEQLKEQQK